MRLLDKENWRGPGGQRGGGRPRSLEGGRTTVISFGMRDWERDILKEIAERQGVTLAELIRSYVEPRMNEDYSGVLVPSS